MPPTVPCACERASGAIMGGSRKPAEPPRPPPPFDGGPDGEPTPNDFWFLPDRAPKRPPRPPSRRRTRPR